MKFEYLNTFTLEDTHEGMKWFDTAGNMIQDWADRFTFCLYTKESKKERKKREILDRANKLPSSNDGVFSLNSF